MSALAMILTAAIVVPGDGPEKVSGEMVQGLDLRGEWEVIVLDGVRLDFKGRACLDKDGKLSVTAEVGQNSYITVEFGKVIDEGNGQLRMDGYHGHLGIYEQKGDHLRICTGGIKNRPTSYREDDSQHLLILQRVKSRK